jgi:hypothetical protein
MGRRDAGGNCQERTSATTAGAAYAAQEKGRRWISCRNVNRPAEGRPIPTRSVLFISRSRCVPATCPIVREAHSRSQNFDTAPSDRRQIRAPAAWRNFQARRQLFRHSPRAAVSPARGGIGSRLGGRRGPTWMGC